MQNDTQACLPIKTTATLLKGRESLLFCSLMSAGARNPVGQQQGQTQEWKNIQLKEIQLLLCQMMLSVSDLVQYTENGNLWATFENKWKQIKQTPDDIKITSCFFS